MLSVMLLIVGILLALGILALAVKAPGPILKALCALGAVATLFIFFALASIRFIGAGEVGIVVKNAFGARLKDGRIIATSGEMGTQAAVLRSGWHFWYWPVIYDVKTVAFIEIQSGQVGLIETTDGAPMPKGQLFAPEWPREQFQQMLDAQYFLSKGNGAKGKQVSVLTPGKYPINTDLFRVRMVEQTEVLAGEVAVLKANFGTAPTQIVGHVAAGAGDKPKSEEEALKLARLGEMGVVSDPLPPGKYPLNTDAYTVTEIWTTQMIAHYTSVQGSTVAARGSFESASNSAPPPQTGQQRRAKQPDKDQQSAGKVGRHDAAVEEREITVRTSDGFTFPVDVRVEYVVEPKDAPIVVAKLGDDEGERFRNALNSAVRAIFRNNAEKVRALDYVQQRSAQEQQSLTTLKEQLARFGITVTAVRIGAVGDELSLGDLLKTQTDREIAKQQLVTFQEQERTAEQEKKLNRVQQEAEEEKRLATAAYAVKIAEEDKRKQVIAAGAEAESIKIKATAQSEAYKSIAAQIGSANAAMIEILKIVGERNIQITPRVMVTGGKGSTGSEATALIGTMLEHMVSQDGPGTPPRREPTRETKPEPAPSPQS